MTGDTNRKRSEKLSAHLSIEDRDTRIGSRSPSDATAEVAVRAAQYSSSHSPGTVRIEDLYGYDDNLKVVKAVGLLDKVASELTSAMTVVDQDPVMSDDLLMKSEGLLDQLFSLREVGEGFATLINGAIRVIRTAAATKPLTRTQIWTLHAMLARLRAAPFVSFSVALDEMDALEEAGLQTTSDIISNLADAIADDRAC